MIVVDPYPRTLDQIFLPRERGRLEALAPVAWHDGPPAPASWIDERLAEAVAIVGQTTLPRARLDGAPHLRAIINVEGNFLPNVDYGECFRRGIPVLCIGPVFAQAVAELALGMALAAARDIPGGDARMRARSEVLFDEGVNGGSFLLAGKTVGIVGLGAIGRALAALLSPFGCEVLAHDPWLEPASVHAAGPEPVALDDLFTRSRVVFLAAPPTTENAGGIGKAQFDRLGEGSVVVLVSRAAIVDWAALLALAASGRARVAIDVFPVEPVPRDDPVRDIPHSILSAHRAGNVPEVWPRIGEMVVDDLEAILTGRLPRRCQVAEPDTVAKLRSRPIGVGPE